MSNKAKCKINWSTLEDSPTLLKNTLGLEVSTPTIPVTSTTQEPYHNESIVIQLNRLMYLGESFKAISKGHKINSMDYDGLMNTNSVIMWQKTIKVELESMYYITEFRILLVHLKGLNP